MVLSGTQFTMGGIILFLIGKGMGGHFGVVNAAGIGIIFYLAMVSAVAYTLWSVLLAGMMYQGSDLWFCKSSVQCDPVCTGSGRGTSGI